MIACRSEALAQAQPLEVVNAPQASNLQQTISVVLNVLPPGTVLPLLVRPTGPQGSAILRSMSEADCFIVLPHDWGRVEPGTLVDGRARHAQVVYCKETCSDSKVSSSQPSSSSVRSIIACR